ncbi:SH3 domain protein [Ancylostoma ceylanicum]|uniref:SH3 domain protein n=1 Tax=Ancylostoma ceylanicum TaxID=53326 RepID=A0A0D6LRE8_9BILA|nr:SH3 domain protein [Ancylostoma ceylanicum]
MMLDENGGGMAGNDLRTLIESRIPEHRSHLETSHVNLENVAAYCEANYLNARDRNAAFEESKQFALQSLASVAYQINTLARDLLDMLDLQTDKIASLTGQVDNIDVVPLQHRGGLVSRAASSVSGSQPYAMHYAQYERTANIGTNTLGRSSVRSGHLSMTPSDHYRVPLLCLLLGTLRIHQPHIPRASMVDGGSVVNEERADSPGFPLPPPQLSSHYGYVGMTRADDLPPPAMQMLNSTHEDEPLPPPPLSQANFFDAQADWIPRNYIEKAVALYDYDADKPDELSLRENCIVYVLRKNDDGWYEGVLDGVTGLFPGNYVQPV